MTLEFLIATLNCLPNDISSEDNIQSYLSKLKEDYNSYLHPNYLDELSSWSILTSDSNLILMNIWYQLNNLSDQEWNASSFQNNKDWIKLREKATEVKNNFSIDIAMNAIYDWDESVNDCNSYLEAVSDFLESDLNLNRNAIELRLQNHNPENEGWKMQSIMTLSQVLINDTQILGEVMENLKVDIDNILIEDV